MGEYIFKNVNFPLKKGTIEKYRIHNSKNSYSYFENCTFNRGVITIYPTYAQSFSRCVFKDGSEIETSLSRFSWILFQHCTFEPGSSLTLSTQSNVTVDQCDIPRDSKVFYGKWGSMEFIRKHPNQTLIHFPKVNNLVIIDGKRRRDLNWEIQSPVMFLPKAVPVQYKNIVKLTNPISIQNMTSMLLQYPYLTIEGLSWGRQDDDLADLRKLNVKTGRTRISAILLLLRIMPMDIVREVNQFL